MYYLVSGTGDGWFEWVIKADSEKSAKQNAMKDLSVDDKITSIKELSVDECIELGYKVLSNEIKRYYFESHHDMKTITVREYAKLEKQFKENQDGYYEALEEFNKKLRLIRLLNRIADIDEMKLGKLKHYLNLLTRAKNEEEFNEILNNAKERK